MAATRGNRRVSPPKPEPEVVRVRNQDWDVPGYGGTIVFTIGEHRFEMDREDAYDFASSLSGAAA